MNVCDVNHVDETEDMLKAMFDRQAGLMMKYKEIEEKNGTGKAVLAGKPFNIDTHRGQALVKDMAWRVTEELTEATDSGGDFVHKCEEMIDAVHFYLELMLTVGITRDDFTNLEELVDTPYYYDINVYNIIQELGNACNCLKMKPWKQSPVLTDTVRFKQHIVEGFKNMCRVLNRMGLTSYDVYGFYFKKSEVNKFRIRSNY